MGRYAKKNKQNTNLSALSFLFATGLVLVTALVPAPELVRADVMPVSGEAVESQTLDASSVSTEFSRVGYRVVSGPEATALFISQAPMPSSESVKGYALEKVLETGWDYTQFSCLVKLWERESNWRHTALNKSSGAYGIPQSLPAEKMASAGDDYLTNPETQINWGLNYIDRRYKSPCAALAHSDEHNWY